MEQLITHDIQGRPLAPEVSKMVTAMRDGLNKHSLEEAQKEASK